MSNIQESSELDSNSSQKAVRFDEHCSMSKTEHEFSPSMPGSPPAHTLRKVSFSDGPIMIGHTVETTRTINADENHSREHCISEDLDTYGHHIVVEALDPEVDEMPILPLSCNPNLQVYVVKLGMLKQATVYHVEFILPDELGLVDLEILRTFGTTEEGSVTVPVNIGASINLLKCDPAPAPNQGHLIVLELSTTKQPRFNELFTLRSVEKPTDAVYLLFHGLSLARGQGTPLLRAGIHRISENPDFPDSDELTEWPGFVNVDDEEDDTIEPKETTLANQGDNQC